MNTQTEPLKTVFLDIEQRKGTRNGQRRFLELLCQKLPSDTCGPMRLFLDAQSVAKECERELNGGSASSEGQPSSDNIKLMTEFFAVVREARGRNVITIEFERELHEEGEAYYGVFFFAMTRGLSC